MKPAKVGALILISLGFFCLYLLKDYSPVVRFLTASLGMIAVIKVAALIWQWCDGIRFHSRLGLFLYLFAWPGVAVTGFTERKAVVASTGARFLEAWLTFLGGVGLLLTAALVGKGQSLFFNYLALFAILLIVHMGLVEVMADGIRLLGFSPRSLFDRPFLATSLRDFWSVRWNRAFVDMNKIFLMQPLRDKVPLAVLVFSIFAISGILHEIGISYSAGSSWGFPILYFIIQSVGMEIEKYSKLPRWLVWLWVVAPAPLLFTPTFTNLFLGSLCRSIADGVSAIHAAEFFKYGLIFGGACHLLVLCASLQVPGKLNWKAEFQKLSSLNRKAFWTYGSYIFAIIVFMALASFLLSRENFTNVGVPILLWIVFIALFWWARVLADFFYMQHQDWPQGPLFAVGHVCLSTLFLFMAGLYSSLVLVAFR